MLRKLSLALCILAAAALVGCGRNEIPRELVGSWEMAHSGEEVAHLFVGDQTFNADGTWHGQETSIFGGSLSGDEHRVEGTFEVKGEELIITRHLGDDKVPIPLYFKVDGDTLTTWWQLNEHGDDTSVVYHRDN
jgi:hypothetical protein